MSRTFLHPGHVRAFGALTTGQYENLTLWACRVNGEPTSAIVALFEEGDTVSVMPLFVAITEGMVLTDAEGRSRDGGGGGGPKIRARASRLTRPA